MKAAIVPIRTGPPPQYPRDLPKAEERGPERVAFPFGEKTCQWLAKFMPIAEYGATCVAASDKLALRAKELAHG